MAQPLLEEVFKLSGIPTHTFVPPMEHDKLCVALRSPGRCVVIEGPSGIGKTTGGDPGARRARQFVCYIRNIAWRKFRGASRLPERAYLGPVYRSEATYYVVPLLGRDYPERVWTRFASEQFKNRVGERSVIPVWYSNNPPSSFGEGSQTSGDCLRRRLRCRRRGDEYLGTTRGQDP